MQILRLSETCSNILHEKVSIVYTNLVQIDVLEISCLSLMLDPKQLLFNAISGNRFPTLFILRFRKDSYPDPGEEGEEIIISWGVNSTVHP